MTDQGKLVMRDQRARDRADALQALRRYEAHVKQTHGQVNHEIYGTLRHEVWKAEMAMNALLTVSDGAKMAALDTDEIQQVRRQVQEDAINEIARTKGWQWNVDSQRWQTAEGFSYSRIGEPL